MTEGTVAGIVLAGGRSERFGRDKLREDLDGEPLVAHAIRRLAEVAPDVYLVVGAEDPTLEIPGDLSVSFVRDDVPFEGPLRAVARGLAFVDSTWAVVVGGDMPSLEPSVLSALLRFASEEGAPGSALGEGDHFRPLPCVLETPRAFPVANELLEAGERSLRSLLDRLRVSVLPEEVWLRLDPERRTLFDVDEPSDLEGEAAAMPHDPLLVGSIEVTPLCDGWAPLPLDDEMPGVDLDWDVERASHPWAFPPEDTEHWAWHVHAFLIRHPEGLVLVDTGIGHFGRSPFEVESHLDEELASAGVTPTDIGHVVLTHLHADHAGGACRPDGSPRFPNARYHVHPDDWSFFEEHRTPEDFTGRFAMAPIEANGMLELDPADHQILDGFWVVHAPGHTPGHRLVRLEDEDQTLLLIGDLLHTTPQIRLPERLSNHDEDPELAARHRARHVRAVLENGWSAGVSHFGRPFGRVTGEGWRSI
jgi:molybdopterin-guanine dinucleotide biosynthesis protein A/glyoxylase-like metal-dependent hydrolase (beta-lactamase superfamily II)